MRDLPEPPSTHDGDGEKPALTEGDDVAHPLSAYLQGVLTVHFDGGSVVRRRASQFDARAFLAKHNGAESSDEIDWETANWFHWASDRVVFSSFDADRDQNWEIGPEDRRVLTKVGHPRGVVTSLLALWSDRKRGPEPQYSIRAIVLLHQIARDGLDLKKWKDVARAYEGQRGAAALATLSRDTNPRDPASVDNDGEAPSVKLRADDEAQPNDASESPSDTQGSEPQQPTDAADDHADGNKAP